MKDIILKLGRIKLIIIFTLIATASTLLLDILIAKTLNHTINYSEDLVRALLIPLLVGPTLSWYLVGLLYELNELEKKMANLATYDDLTGLLNRRAFYASCKTIRNYSIRNKKTFCLLAVDIDFFKKTNDNYGHSAGDAVLTSFGEIASELSRNSDVIGRVGGEEFAFFLPNTNIQQAEEFSQRLRTKIQSSQIPYDGNIIQYTVSIGISTNVSSESLSVDDVLKQADQALYHAKNNGRNQIALYDDQY